MASIYDLRIQAGRLRRQLTAIDAEITRLEGHKGRLEAKLRTPRVRTQQAARRRRGEVCRAEP